MDGCAAMVDAEKVARDPYERFAFGKNWQRYLARAGDREIAAAKSSLAVALDGLDTHAATFLDIGSGSGLFSRAAVEIGFARVVSFDYDADSVAATRALHGAAGAPLNWSVRQGSVLDPALLRELGQFDMVYAWGVLHHTGAMWQAVGNAADAVAPNGRLFIALYNDQGWISHYWRLIKRLYVRSPRFMQRLLTGLFSAYFATVLGLADLVRLRNPAVRYQGDKRGMKFVYDVVDWIGGYPFEVARPDTVIEYLQSRGFALHWARRVGRRHGCNEFVFERMR